LKELGGPESFRNALCVDDRRQTTYSAA
jgi:hypothetical protein